MGEPPFWPRDSPTAAAAARGILWETPPDALLALLVVLRGSILRFCEVWAVMV